MIERLNEIMSMAHKNSQLYVESRGTKYHRGFNDCEHYAKGMLEVIELTQLLSNDLILMYRNMLAEYRNNVYEAG